MTETPESVLLVVVAITLAILIIVAVGKQWRARLKATEEKLAQVAGQMGFSLHPQRWVRDILPSDFSQWFCPFGLPPGKVWKGSMDGTEVLLVWIIVRNPLVGSMLEYTLACFHLVNNTLPELNLISASCPFFVKYLWYFQGNRITFETRPDFSKKYWLRGSDEHAIRGLFQPHILGAFVQEWEKTLTVTVKDKWLFVGQGVDSEKTFQYLPRFLDCAVRIFRLITEQSKERV